MLKSRWICGLFITGAVAMTAAQGQKPAEIVAIGCLAKSGQNFDLKDYRSGAVHRLEAKAEMIEWHVGHKIEVRGTVLGVAQDVTRVKVESVSYISSTCS